MKNFARIIALICAVILLVPCFASCANTQGGEDTTASQNAQTEAPAEEVTVDNTKDKDGYLRDDIPDELRARIEENFDFSGLPMDGEVVID